MRKGRIGLVFVAMLGVACSRAAAGGPPGSPRPPDELQALASDLRSRGATVQIGEAASEPFFSAAGRLILVNGQEIRVFRFGSPKAASAAAAAVAPDGYSVGASEGGETTVSQIEWVDAPHFYRRGSLIVLYLGNDSPTLQLLDAVLGPQFAGSE